MLAKPRRRAVNGNAVTELPSKADGGVWRVAFAFDPERNAVLLVAGDKSGASEKKFYKRLIEKADKRYKEHLDNL